MRLLFALILTISSLNAFAQNAIQSEERLRATVERIVSKMQPLIDEQGLKVTQIHIFWDDMQFQAGARVLHDNTSLELLVNGGVARAPGITLDATDLVLCHELGHAIGGAPKNGKKMSWERKEGFDVYPSGTIEGQADYFATLKCFRMLHMDSDNDLFIQTLINLNVKIPTVLKEKCHQVWESSQDQSLCIRAGLAAENFVNVMERQKAEYFKSVRKEFVPQYASLSKTDPSVAIGIDRKHPEPQCRLDTLVQGALCRIPVSAQSSKFDANFGACVAGTVGARPACWLNPDKYTGAGIWKNLSPEQGTEWNGVGVIDGSCTGFLLDIGQDSNSFALVATNGHCVEKSQPPAVFSLNNFLGTKRSQQTRLQITEVVFSTMKKADLAVVRLNKSISELKALGFHFYQVDKTPEEPTLVINVGVPQRQVLQSSSVLTKSHCKMLKDVEIKEHLWQWKVKQTNCTNVDGLSGSPVFSEDTKKVIGLLNTTVELDSSSEECGLNKPCQLTETGTKLVPEVSYSQRTDLLLACLTTDGTLNKKNPDCN